MAGAPLGNHNATKTKIWSRAIAQALERRWPIDDRKAAIDALADKLIDMCLAGDLEALKELGNRLEGKPVQAIQLGDDEGRPVGLAVVFNGHADGRVPPEARLPLHS